MYSLATYHRLNMHVADSPCDVIRAARRKIKPSARGSREYRDARHLFYREMLKHHEDARELVRHFRL